MHSELPAAKRMQALRRFRVDPDSYVLLLSTQVSADGIVQGWFSLALLTHSLLRITMFTWIESEDTKKQGS